MKTLYPLPPKKSRTFSSPLHASLVRTGCIADGSCFFHAMLYSSSKEYRHSSNEYKTALVRGLREKLASEVRMADLVTLGGGEYFRIHVIVIFRQLMQEHVPSQEFQLWDTKYIPTLSSKWVSTDVQDVCSIIIQYFGDVCDTTRVSALLDRARQECLEDFQHRLRSDWVDEVLMEFLSRHFKCNFHFIDAETRQRYKTNSHFEHSIHIVLLWIQEHYESIGLTLPNGTTRRVFRRHDPLIQCLLTEK